MRRLLLDTHVFIWWISGNESLGQVARGLIANVDNQIYVSAVTVWEMSIKQQLGKLNAPGDLESVIERCGFSPLPIGLFHAQQAGSLPTYHRDPFDRMLVAQAQAEGLAIVTQDAAFPDYGVRLIHASE